LFCGPLVACGLLVSGPQRLAKSVQNIKKTEEMDADYRDLPYYSHICWLSCGKVMKRVFQLQHKIKEFMTKLRKSWPVNLMIDPV